MVGGVRVGVYLGVEGGGDNCSGLGAGLLELRPGGAGVVFMYLGEGGIEGCWVGLVVAWRGDTPTPELLPPLLERLPATRSFNVLI